MKRLVCIVAALCLCLSIAGCTVTTTSTGGDKQQAQQEQEQQATEEEEAKPEAEADPDEPVTIDEELQQAAKAFWKKGYSGPYLIHDIYSVGTHHVTMNIKGYGKMEIEVYANRAPRTASAFMHLAEEGYYNGKTINTIMKSLFVEMGARDSAELGQHLVPGEYEEAGVENDLGLKRGVIAMARYAQTDKDGDAQLMSDAASLVVFTTDASYFNGKYAGFAKITKNSSVLSDISALAGEDEDATIRIKENGRIAKKKMCPVIKKVKIID